MPDLSWSQRAFLLGKALAGSWDFKRGSVGETLLKGILPGAVGAAPTRGTEAQLRGYSSMPWMRAVASRVGHAVAACPWKLYAIKGKPRVGTEKREWAHRKDIQFCGEQRLRKNYLMHAEEEGNLTEIVEHPALDLLYQGNQIFSGNAIRKVAQIHHDLVGECFLLKERGPMKLPIALWPVPPHWVMSTPTPTNPMFRISFRGWQGQIPATEFIWAKELDPAMPYWRGSGIAQALSDELETDEYAAKYLKTFFHNSARPDLIVSPKGDMNSFSTDEMARLEQAWLQEHQGFWRAFRPMFLSRPTEVTPLEANFRQLQLKDLRVHSRDICLQVWGVPPEILGIIEHSNRATIDAASYLFHKLVVEPRLEFWRLEYQRQFISDYDSRLILDYESPVLEDKEFHAKVMTALPEAFEIDELRELADRPPLEKELGTAHYEPGTKTRVMDWEEPEEPVAEPPSPLVVPPGHTVMNRPEPGQPAVTTPQAADFTAYTDDQLLDLAVKAVRQLA